MKKNRSIRILMDIMFTTKGSGKLFKRISQIKNFGTRKSRERSYF